uniref:Cystatin protein n=1 Tax=Haemaphysalis flava TaxID=181088 RepID=A0A6M3YRY3_HAEFA|nr:cystatin protein [Haemaphysalis flava]
MARSVALSVVALAGLVVAGASMPGGWTNKDPQSSPKYKELAHYAVAQRVEGLENYDTVLELTKVETQVVAGINYRLTFTIAGSSCKIGEVEYSEERCPPTSTEAKATCTAVVYERPWQHVQTLTSFNCA